MAHEWEEGQRAGSLNSSQVRQVKWKAESGWIFEQDGDGRWLRRWPCAEIERLAGKVEAARAAAATAQERTQGLETQVTLDTGTIERLRGAGEAAYGEGFRDAEARICEWLRAQGNGAERFCVNLADEIEAGEHRKALPSEE